MHTENDAAAMQYFGYILHEYKWTEDVEFLQTTTASICQFAEFIAKKPHFGYWFIRSIYDEVEYSAFFNRKQNVQPQQKDICRSNAGH